MGPIRTGDTGVAVSPEAPQTVSASVALWPVV